MSAPGPARTGNHRVDAARKRGRSDGRKRGHRFVVAQSAVFLGSDAGQSVDAAVAESVAGALQGEDVGVVDDAVDHRGGDGLVAEHTAPAAEGQVAGEDERGVFVAAADELEEQVRSVLLEGQVADLIDDDQPVAPQSGELLWESSSAVGIGESGDPVHGRGEQHPVAMVCGRDPESGSQVGLAGAGWSEQDDVAGFGEEPSGREGCDLLPDGRLGVEVELLDRLAGTEPGGPDPQLGARRVTGGDLTVQDRGEVFLVSPVAVSSVVGQPAGGFSDPWCLQR